MALKNFTQFTPYTVLSSTDNFVGYRGLEEIRTDFNSLTDAISGLLIAKGFTPGSSVGVVRRVSFRYSIGSGSPVNAVSGVDDYGLTLSYSPSQVEVYRNGAHLVESLDFIANNGTQITNLSTLNVGDIVEVVALSSTVLNLFAAISGSGQAQSNSFRYTVASSNTIKPGNTVIAGTDDFGSVLNFTLPNFDVYLNGSHLVRDSDYGSYNSGSSLTLNEPVANGDTVDVVTLSAYNLSQIAAITAYAGIQQIRAGKDFYISNITGTGSVSLSAKPGIRDIKVPDWTTGGHITNWSTLQLYLSSVASSNRFTQASASYIENIAGLPGGNCYSGSVLAPNGKIYLVTHNTSNARIIDPSNNTIITYGTFPVTGVGLWSGGALAPNGRIYFAPMGATYGVIVDPSNNTVTTYGSFPGGVQFDGAVLAPNGKIYFVPHTTSIGRIVDTSNNTITTYSGFPVVAGAYIGGVLGPNGKIYFVPCNATVGVVIDPNTNNGTSVELYGNFPGSTAYIGGVVAPNGRIFFGPSSATVGRFVDPTNNTVTTYGSFPGSTAYNGACLAPNGKIYLSPHNATVGRIIDPETLTITTYGSFPGSGAYSENALVAPNGKIYFTPYGATSAPAICILTNNNFNINVCTNPMFNK